MIVIAECTQTLYLVISRAIVPSTFHRMIEPFAAAFSSSPLPKMKRVFLLIMVISATSCGLFKAKTSVSDDSQNMPPGGEGLPPQTEIPYAKPVPERPGYVLSPYHDKVVDCQGLARDTLVYDPYDTVEPRRKFRVP